LQLWYNKSDYAGNYVSETALERRIKCEYIDIPDVYHYENDHFQDYFDSFAGTDNYDLFKVKAV